MTSGSMPAKRVAICTAALFAMWAASAQAISFTQTSFTNSNLNSPSGIAVDSLGNVYVSNSGHSNDVVEFPGPGSSFNNGSPGVVHFSGSTPGYTGGVAVDGAGDVYALDTTSSRVIEQPASGGTDSVVGFGLNHNPTLSHPEGLAVDPSGDVLVAVSGGVAELTPSGVQSTLFATSSLGGQAVSVATDSAGDIYCVGANGAVLELAHGASTPTTVSLSMAAQDVAVDSRGDVFMVGSGGLWEAPSGGSPTLLPTNGTDTPTGVAVDSDGDVYAANQSWNSTGGSWYGSGSELTPTVPSGTLALSPKSGPAGSTVVATSVTPCPVGGQYTTTKVSVSLATSSGTVIATDTPTLDAAGDWAAPFTIPSAATPGSVYVVSAFCSTSSNLMTQDYANDGFAVVSPQASGTAGPQGPAGPAGPAGPSGPAGQNGTDGAPGPAGPSGSDGDTGPQGATGPAGPKGGDGNSVIVQCANHVQTITNCTADIDVSATAASLSAELSRGHIVYARMSRKVSKKSRHLTLPLKHSLKKGKYTLTLTVVSANGHRQKLVHSITLN